MKHAVIFAHPKLESLTATVAQTYAAEARELGHEVVVRDLYRMNFDPCLKAEEIPTEEGYRAAPDVVAERQVLEHADVFVFVYPFWFNAPPAILKGYVDRVFSMGFGYEPMAGGTTSLLDGRRLISFTTSGAPDRWVQSTNALTTLIAGFDNHLAAVCGLTVADHVHFGGITPVVTEAWIAQIQADVRKAARQLASAEMALS
jgi:NAD(P)H dehydrogenase (quinone)